METTGVFKPSDFRRIIEKVQLFSNHTTRLRHWSYGRHDENADFLMQCCRDDRSKDSAPGLLSHEQLNERSVLDDGAAPASLYRAGQSRISPSSEDSAAG